jgi:hypothetical protein
MFPVYSSTTSTTGSMAAGTVGTYTIQYEYDESTPGTDDDLIRSRYHYRAGICGLQLLRQ